MSAPSILASQTRYQLKASARSGLTLGLGVLLPVLLFLGMSALFGLEGFGGDVPVAIRGGAEVPTMQTYFTGGFMAYAVLYSGFAVLLPELVTTREQGVLKRLRGTPLPLGAYVGAKVLTTLLMSAVAVLLIALLARVVFDVSLRLEAFVGLVVFTLLGTVTFVCLSFAGSTITRSANGAAGLANGVAIILAVLSGVFFPVSMFPDQLTAAVEILPLEPLAHAYQSLYATGASGIGLDLRDVAILAGWALFGFVIARVWFRWDPRQRRS
jgi:ABC-2 type transport system permease protein